MPLNFFYCSACLRQHGIAFLFRGFLFLFLYQSNSMPLTLLEMHRISYSLYVKQFFCAAQIELEAQNYSDREKEMKTLKIETRFRAGEGRQSNRKVSTRLYFATWQTKNDFKLFSFVAKKRFEQFLLSQALKFPAILLALGGIGIICTLKSIHTVIGYLTN